MRISDWRSDVCSSDLFPGAPYGLNMACGENPKRVYGAKGRMPTPRMGHVALDRQAWADAQNYLRKWPAYERQAKDGQIGRAPCRDRGCTSVSISGVAPQLKHKYNIQSTQVLSYNGHTM